MNYEDSVVLRYPHADVVYLAPIFHHGDSTPWQEEAWVVLEQPDCFESELGRGATEELAWEDAARNTASVLWPEVA